MLLSVMTEPVSWRRSCGATPVATLGPRAIALGAASREAAARAKPSETSRLPTTGVCQDENRTEMLRAGTAEARSSAPTRQHRKMAALMLMAAARILGGLRPRRVRRGELVLQRVGAQLCWKLGSSHGGGEQPRRCFSKKTIEVRRRRRPSPRGTMSLRAGLGRLVLAPQRAGRAFGHARLGGLALSKATSMRRSPDGNETTRIRTITSEWSGVQVRFPRVDGLGSRVFPFVGEGRVRRRLRAARFRPERQFGRCRRHDGPVAHGDSF